MPAAPEPEGPAWEYVLEYYTDDKVRESFRLLAQHAPGVFDAYINMRQEAFERGAANGALDAKQKELVILGMEIMGHKTNPPPIFHARKAVEAGASVAEIAEVIGLCIMIGGMVTYQECGQFVLRAAHEREVELQRGTQTE